MEVGDRSPLLGGMWLLVDALPLAVPVAGAAQNSRLRMEESRAKFWILDLEQVLRIGRPAMTLCRDFMGVPRPRSEL